MKLLLDSDMFAYRIAASCKDEDIEVAKRTMKGFITDIIADLYTGQDLTWKCFLSGSTNFRKDVAVTAPYKGNRTKEKPEHLQPLRDYLVDAWDATVSVDQEADDDIAIAAEGDAEAVIVSLDKDFDQCVGLHYNFVKKELYDVTYDEGMLWFYRQFLIGDRIDNIIGADGIGLVKSLKLLEGKTELEMWQTVVDCLGSEERALENGQLLWLRKEPNQMWQPPQEN